MIVASSDSLGETEETVTEIGIESKQPDRKPEKPEDVKKFKRHRRKRRRRSHRK
jgi:hypothetical protein